MLAEKKLLHNYVPVTPVSGIDLGLSPRLNIIAKWESYNLTGSVKDRAAFYIIPYLKNTGIINEHTEVIESSSGNFGISLSCASNYYNVKFTCVIDPKILSLNEKLLRLYKNTRLVKVKACDEYGGYLKARLKTIEDIMADNGNCYWINQYGSPLVVEAYRNTLGEEIAGAFANIDYIFIGVSSCGTIAGVSQKIKEKFRNAKVIAVDVTGSAINQGVQANRYLTGIGSSIIPENLSRAVIDEFQVVSELESIMMCRFILKEYSTLIGGSAGAVLSAVQKYFENFDSREKKTIVAILPDSGERYIDTIYNDKWVFENYGHVFE
jgi:N-(2-amino-2-carboxyethyl)-L-glutamate synthase